MALMRDLICGVSELPGCDINASPQFSIRPFAEIRPAGALLVWPGNVPCQSRATNRKSLVLWLKKRTGSGFARGGSRGGSDQPLPECVQLRRIRARLRRNQIEPGIRRQRDLEGNHEPSLGDIVLYIGRPPHGDADP